MRRWLSLFLCSLALAPAAQAAQPLTYSEALRAVEDANPSLKRSELELDQAEASLMGAYGFIDPVLSANLGWRRNKQNGFFQGFPYKSVSQFWDSGVGLQGSLPIGTTYDIGVDFNYNYSVYETQFQPGVPTESVEDAYFTNTSVTLRQPLLKGLKVGWNMAGVTRARDSYTVAELTLERTRQELLAQAASAYWTWAYQVELHRIAEDQEEVAREALRVGELQMKEGDLAKVEVTRLEAAVVRAELDTLQASIAAHEAADSLLLLMGAPIAQDMAPATGLGEVPAVEIDAEQAVEVALVQNLDLAMARARRDAADSSLEVDRHGRLPTLTAVASAGVGAQAITLKESISGLFGADNFPFLYLGGEFSVPLGNRAARAPAEASAFALRAAQLEVDELEQSIRSQVQVQVRQLQQARRRMELSDLDLRLAEETLQSEEALARAGRSIQKDVLEARAALKLAAVDAAKSRADFRQAVTELLRLQGRVDAAIP